MQTIKTKILFTSALIFTLTNFSFSNNVKTDYEHKNNNIVTKNEQNIKNVETSDNAKTSNNGDIVAKDDNKISMLQSYNHKMFDFMMYIEKNMLRPATFSYHDNINSFVKNRLADIVRTYSYPIEAIISAGKMDAENAVRGFMRFAFAYTFGFFGFIDILNYADEFNERPYLAQDFNSLMVHYNTPSGPYLVTPISIGSTRKFFGTIMGWIANPAGEIKKFTEGVKTVSVAHKLIVEHYDQAKALEYIEESQLNMYETVKMASMKKEKVFGIKNPEVDIIKDEFEDEDEDIDDYDLDD